MKIGLIDIDSKMPNIALMKISTYYKTKGESVEWWKGLLFHKQYDLVYASKVFRFSKMPYELPGDVEIGGSGYDLKKKLPREIEKCDIDYTIYPDCDYSIQRFSVGCIRKCDFCIVNEKEGNLKSVKPMNLNLKGEYIRVIDNNFFANRSWKDAIEYLNNLKQKVWFEAIDARTLTEEQAKTINPLCAPQKVFMAWDNIKDKINWSKITEWIKPYNIMVYVLIGYNSTHKDDLYRVEYLRGVGVNPFVMPFDKSVPYQKKFARWVNHKAVFKTVKWEDYR